MKSRRHPCVSGQSDGDPEQKEPFWSRPATKQLRARRHVGAWLVPLDTQALSESLGPVLVLLVDLSFASRPVERTVWAPWRNPWRLLTAHNMTAKPFRNPRDHRYLPVASSSSCLTAQPKRETTQLHTGRRYSSTRYNVAKTITEPHVPHKISTVQQNYQG